jgi:hypothetical protein
MWTMMIKWPGREKTGWWCLIHWELTSTAGPEKTLVCKFQVTRETLGTGREDQRRQLRKGQQNRRGDVKGPPWQ